jgi:hypothetical protein
MKGVNHHVQQIRRGLLRFDVDGRPVVDSFVIDKTDLVMRGVVTNAFTALLDGSRGSIP